MSKQKHTEQEYNEWVDQLVEDADGQIMLFIHHGLFDRTTWCLSCGGGYFDDYLTDEEYENIKRIFDEREIEYEYA